MKIKYTVYFFNWIIVYIYSGNDKIYKIGESNFIFRGTIEEIENKITIVSNKKTSFFVDFTRNSSEIF